MNTAFVTGASSGIGFAVADLLVSSGWQVAMVARNPERLGEAANRIARREAMPIVCEVNNVGDLDRAMADTVSSLGPITAVVHCAGVAALAPMVSLDWDYVFNVTATNQLSFLRLAELFRRRKTRAAGRCHLIGISSAAGLRGSPGTAPYAATKGAVDAMVRALAIEYAREDIAVNSVAPGWVDTPMTAGMAGVDLPAITARHPLGIGRPEDVAEAVGFLLGSRWITGITLPVDGGYSAA